MTWIRIWILFSRKSERLVYFKWLLTYWYVFQVHFRHHIKLVICFRQIHWNIGECEKPNSKWTLWRVQKKVFANKLLIKIVKPLQRTNWYFSYLSIYKSVSHFFSSDVKCLNVMSLKIVVKLFTINCGYTLPFRPKMANSTVVFVMRRSIEMDRVHSSTIQINVTQTVSTHLQLYHARNSFMHRMRRIFKLR